MRVEGKPELRDNVQTGVLSNVTLQNMWDSPAIIFTSKHAHRQNRRFRNNFHI